MPERYRATTEFCYRLLDSKHTLAAFEEQLSASQKEKLNVLIGRSMGRSLAYFADYFAAYTPSLFIIISYKRVQSEMRNLHNFYTQELIVQPRAQA
jgi:hypothetical protein